MNPAEKKSEIINPAIEISNLFSAILKSNFEFSHKVFSVGGFVRDRFLNFFSNDLDVVIELQNGAEQFSKYVHNQFQNETTEPFQKGLGYPIWFLKFTENIQYQNILYQTKNGSVDFADSQKECFPDKNSRQRITVFGNLTEDILRRDFTINMLAENLTTNEIVDLSESALKDITAKLLQTHPQKNPDQVFSEDPLRMIRAIRFCCKYNFQIHTLVQISIRKNAERTQILSKERIWDEVKKIILNKNFFQALLQMKDFNLLSYVFINSNQINISESEFDVCKDHIPLNLAMLFRNLKLSEAEHCLITLKVETHLRKQTLLILDALQHISTHKKINYRQFARTYFHQLSDLQVLIPKLTEPLQIALVFPLQMTSKLNGHDVMKIFSVQGPEIQKILNEALRLEDELVLSTKTVSTDPALQDQVLSRLKALFLK